MAIVEIERRPILFHKDTTMPDGSTLGYVGDPNDADSGGTEGEKLLYNSPAGTMFQDRTTAPYTLWQKVNGMVGGLWKQIVQDSPAPPDWGNIGGELVDQIDLQEALDGKEPSIETKETAFNRAFETETANIKMAGTVSVGSSENIPRADHVHPSDTSKVDAVSGKGLSTNDYTDAEQLKLSGLSQYTDTMADARVAAGITDKMDKTSNLTDVADNQTALNNITASANNTIGTVLTVDADHNATWQTPSGGGGSATFTAILGETLAAGKPVRIKSDSKIYSLLDQVAYTSGVNSDGIAGGDGSGMVLPFHMVKLQDSFFIIAVGNYTSSTTFYLSLVERVGDEFAIRHIVSYPSTTTGSWRVHSIGYEPIYKQGLVCTIESATQIRLKVFSINYVTQTITLGGELIKTADTSCSWGSALWAFISPLESHVSVFHHICQDGSLFRAYLYRCNQPDSSVTNINNISFADPFSSTTWQNFSVLPGYSEDANYLRKTVVYRENNTSISLSVLKISKLNLAQTVVADIRTAKTFINPPTSPFLATAVSRSGDNVTFITAEKASDTTYNMCAYILNESTATITREGSNLLVSPVVPNLTLLTMESSSALSAFLVFGNSSSGVLYVQKFIISSVATVSYEGATYTVPAVVTLNSASRSLNNSFPVDNGLIFLTRYSSGSNFIEIRFIKRSAPLQSQQLVGVLTVGGGVGETGTVAPCGSIATLTGLQAGQWYCINETSGSLTTSATAFVAGYAISNTRLLLRSVGLA